MGMKRLLFWRQRKPSRQMPTLAIRREAAERRLLDLDAFAHVFGPLVGCSVGYVRAEGNVGDDLIDVAAAQLLDAFGIRWRLQDPGTPADVDCLVFCNEKYENAAMTSIKVIIAPKAKFNLLFNFFLLKFSEKLMLSTCLSLLA